MDFYLFTFFTKIYFPRDKTRRNMNDSSCTHLQVQAISMNPVCCV